MIGGVLTSVYVASEAHEILQAAPGLMVRQPLAHQGNPLALCNYHAEAAPYREQYYGQLTFTGRGAAGRPATKHAFMHALRVRCEQAMRDAPLVASMHVIADACEAMRTDVSYVMAIAKGAVSTLARQHAWRLRSELHQAQAEAMAACSQVALPCSVPQACGTGLCPFAKGIYTSITADAGPGKTQRPANHEDRTFSSDTALAELERLHPFRVLPVVAVR